MFNEWTLVPPPLSFHWFDRGRKMSGQDGFLMTMMLYTYRHHQHLSQRPIHRYGWQVSIASQVLWEAQ